MRIVKELNKRDYKITVMVMSGKYSLKVEKDLLEQTFKFRQGSGMETVDEVLSILTDHFIDKLDGLFASMHEIRKEAILSKEEIGDEFETIV